MISLFQFLPLLSQHKYSKQCNSRNLLKILFWPVRFQVRTENSQFHTFFSYSFGINPYEWRSMDVKSKTYRTGPLCQIFLFGGISFLLYGNTPWWKKKLSRLVSWDVTLLSLVGRHQTIWHYIPEDCTLHMECPQKNSGVLVLHIYLLPNHRIGMFWKSGAKSVPSFGDINSREMATLHNVLETGSVSVLRWGGGDTLLFPLERTNLNHWSTHVRLISAI
jgi:hypothetical protein